MSDEQDAWLNSALGLDISRALPREEDVAAPVGSGRFRELPPDAPGELPPAGFRELPPDTRGQGAAGPAHPDPVHREREEPTPPAAPKPPSSSSNMPVLREGMTGPAVKDMQLLLNQKGASISADGKFGPATTKAVKEFQSKSGLKADGVVGPKTWDALSAGGAEPPAPVPPGPVPPAPVPPAPLPPGPVPPAPVPPAPVPPAPVPPAPVPPGPIPPPSPPDTKPRKVTFTVTSEANNNAVAGVTVTVEGQSEKTGNTGLATFSLAPGKYPFAAAAEGFDLFAGSLEVTADDKTEHHVELKGGGQAPPPSPTGNQLRFKVLDLEANKGIRGATILIESSSGNTAPFATKSAATDAGGNAAFDLPPNSGALTVNIRATAERFEDFRGVFRLPGDGFDQDVHLRSRGSLSEIKFSVFDHQLEELGGAKIKINGKSHTTDDRGQVNVGVAPGPQTYRVTKDGFQPFEGRVDVPAEKDVPEKVRMVALAVCEVRVKVTDKADAKKVIKQAEVLVDGLRPHATGGKTDDQGELVCKVPPGKHDFVVTAKDQGYGEARGTFETTSDEDTDLPIAMSKGGGAAKFGGVFIRVIDGTTRKPIDGAEFAIGGISDSSLAGGIIDIIGLEVGKQKFVLTKTGFAKVTGTINVREVPDADAKGPPPQRQDIEMTPDVLADTIVRVTDGETRQALEGASVEFGSFGSKSTDSNGKVVFAQVPSGTHRCGVTAKEYEQTSIEVTLTAETRSSSPVEVRLLKGSPQNPGAGKIDHAKLKGPFDLSKLREDLTKTAKDVQVAIEAETAMQGTASRAGIDLDKPEEAAKAMKVELSEDDKDKLTTALFALRNTRGDMVTTAHLMQGVGDQIRLKSEALKAQFFKPIDADFWNGLDREVAGAGEEILAILDVGETALKIAEKMAHGPVMAIVEGVAGSENFKHLINHEKDKSELLKGRIAELGASFNILVGKLGQAAVKELLLLKAQLEKLKADHATKQKDYADEHRHYAKLVARISSKPGNVIPPGFAKTHTAVLNAAFLSKTARGVLPTQSKGSFDPSGAGLPKDKAKFYLIYWNQFNPTGELIFDGPDTGLPGSVRGSVVVYQKGGDQFAFREKRQTIQKIAQQLDPVKQLFESGKKLDELEEKWTRALSE